VDRFECDPRRAKYQHQHASLFERPDIGDNVGDLAARQIHVAHYGMRIRKEGRERFRDVILCAIAAKLGASELARV